MGYKSNLGNFVHTATIQVNSFF